MYVATNDNTSAVSLLHLEWYSYNLLLVIFFLPECMGYSSYEVIEQSNNWIVSYLELIIEILSKLRFLNRSSECTDIDIKNAMKANICDEFSHESMHKVNYEQ